MPAARAVPADPLIDARALAGRLEEVLVLDLRWQLGMPASPEAFRAGHVPGSVFADLDRDFSAPARADGSGGRHPLPAPGEAREALRRLGVRAGRPVVIYDDGPGMSAARGWWVLRYYGHPSVQVLDGGLAAWVAAGLPLEQGEQEVPAGDFEPVPGHLPALCADEVLAFAARNVLLDARDASRYRGEVEPIDPVAGHIPGARSAPAGGNVAPDGTLRSAAELRERFAALGIATGMPVGVYCGSGITAAHEVMALARAGHAAALYPGSWSDWVSDPARPVASGDEP